MPERRASEGLTMNRGYIKFWRIAEDSRVWSRGIEYRGLLITLLTMANHRGAYFLGTKIERGQVGTSMQNLASDLGVSRQKLIRMFSNLEKDDVVKVKNVDNRFTLVNITNYNIYQCEKYGTRTTVDTTVDTTTGQPPDTIKEVKNKEKTEEYSLRSYSSCSEQPAAASEPPTPPPPLEPVITLPLNTGEEHPVTQGDVEIWQDLYPAVDVVQALRNMRGWLIANDRKRKTKSGVKRFLNSWLAKEQDRGGTTAVFIRDGPPGQIQAQPAARTQQQKNKQDLEGLAAFVGASDKEFANGYTPENSNGTCPHGNALPAPAGQGNRTSAHGGGMDRALF